MHWMMVRFCFWLQDADDAPPAESLLLKHMERWKQVRQRSEHWTRHALLHDFKWFFFVCWKVRRHISLDYEGKIQIKYEKSFFFQLDRSGKDQWDEVRGEHAATAGYIWLSDEGCLASDVTWDCHSSSFYHVSALHDFSEVL